MAVLTFAGRLPKVALPVNAALALSSPRTSGTVNVSYPGWQWGGRETQRRGVGPGKQEVGEQGAGNRAAETVVPRETQADRTPPPLPSDMQLW